MSLSSILFFLTSSAYIKSSAAIEVTFTLDSRECFYEVVQQGSSVTLEFQVVAGGSLDVDVIVHDPTDRTLYQQDRQQFDTVTFTAAVNGTYMVCFGNEFSTFTNKMVYMDLQVKDPQMTEESQDHPTVMTQMESSTLEIRDALRTIVDHQTHHRLREAQSQKRAIDINDRVFWWSLAETLAILFVSISQVYIVKMFFFCRNPLPNVQP